MRDRPGLFAEGLMAWFPPPDVDDDRNIEAQAAAYHVARLLLSFMPKGG
jgi:hypothetical protein